VLLLAIRNAIKSLALQAEVMGTVTASEEPMIDWVLVTAFQFVREVRFVVVWRRWFFV
jgi:hypothetical protein